MSFNGIQTFKKNLETLMESKAFRESDDAGRLYLTGRLLRSKYGIGSFFGFGRVKPMDNGDDSNQQEAKL